MKDKSERTGEAGHRDTIRKMLEAYKKKYGHSYFSRKGRELDK